MKMFQKAVENYKGKEIIYKLLLFIFLLNTFDGVCTAIGVKLGAIEEANQLIASLSPLGLLLYKIFWSLCVLFIGSCKFSKSFQRKFYILLIGVLGIYLYITALHIYWMCLYF